MSDLGLGYARGINDRRQVVGEAKGASDISGVRWERGTITDLTSPTGGRVIPYAINDRGQVVGCSSPPGGGLCRAFLWESGKLTDLGTLGGSGSIAYAVNDRGQVVGESGTAAGSRHAFLWESGHMVDLGTLDSESVNTSEARGINDRGQVVGSSFVGGSLHAFLWENGHMTDLGSLGADYRGHEWTQAFGINDSGQVVGYSIHYTPKGDPENAPSRMTLWENGAITDLGEPGYAYAINDRGQVVGEGPGNADPKTVNFPPSHAFVWQVGKFTDLGPRPTDRSGATAINERGDIAGYWAYHGNAATRAVIWPAPTVRARTAPRPRLTSKRQRTNAPLHATQGGMFAKVSTSVAVDRQATVAVAVIDPSGGNQLTMAPGSRLGATLLIQPAATMRTMLGSRRTLKLTLLLPTEEARRGAAYQIRLTATGISGKQSRLTINFLG